ncbi:hypothetical protein OEB99_16615 [Actinotalea sp. M2MS4P-6]|uniref:hypothetical protein n=1 Tax=Actinotalea sp. M2MS4P-6 TaxID=2983762 RepID=UPI0021E3922E|nr:hypothetical protein [Actinotalea sp. M2MS4P-6]MCV2395940.1 hypothetical protein [Actinotalea sp. M2MS4P-6]
MSASLVTHVGYCRATGKRKFATKRDARIIRRRTAGHGLSVYHCTACEYWHIGHHGDLSRDEHRQRRSA